jgi:hypothetical protein
MKGGKEGRPSGMVMDVMRELGELNVARYHCASILVGRGILYNRMKSILVPMYKGMGDPLVCNLYHGIKLLEQAFKMMERIREEDKVTS